MHERVRVGIVGFGFMGKQHLKVYCSREDAEVTAVADLEQSRLEGELAVSGNVVDVAEGAKMQGGTKKYTRIEDLIADPNVDLVDIALPTSLHAEYAVKALKANKHVLCEKPMAMTLEQCDAMIEAAKGSKGKFMIAHCIRFWPEYMVLYDGIKDNRWGKVCAAHFRRVSSAPQWSWNNWLMQTQHSGSAIMDMHIHDVDFINYLFGKPLSVHSGGVKGRVSEGFDRVSTLYEVESGALVTAEGAWEYPPCYPFEMAFTVVCENATIEYSSSKTPTLQAYNVDGSIEDLELPSGDGYANEIGYFLDCITNDRPVLNATGEDARSSVNICLAEIQSANTGETVRI